MTHVIAFTGHRPQDMPIDFTFDKFAEALDALGLHKRAHDVRFVVGGALGTDSWAATYAITRGIEFDLILPFEERTMSQRWSEHHRVVLHTAVLSADHVTEMSRGPYDSTMNRFYQLRNIAMVDAADHVFALWSGKTKGGTFNCLRYAMEQKKPTYNLWPLDGKLRPITSI